MTGYENRLAALRAELKRHELFACIVPMNDEYMNEYVPPAARRLEYLTGFTGSAGFAAILPDRAAFFTDSRYTLQAAQQIPSALYAVYNSAEKLPREWLASELPQGAHVGYDPWLHSIQSLERLREALPEAKLVPTAKNLIDAIWPARPAPSAKPVTFHGPEYAGQSSAEKRTAIAAALVSARADCAVITDPASIAWLLNVRGDDVPHTPLPLSFALLHADATVDWFIDPRKTGAALKTALGPAIRLHAPDAFIPALALLAKTVQLDPALCNAAIAETLEKAGAKIQRAEDPCLLPRACKNATEQNGMRAAHQRDGIALATFFSWLSTRPPGVISELQAEEELEKARASQHLYAGPSFATIAGSGPHGAIVHYRATAESDRKLQPGELFLLDSGGQYRDGTTDVTRTIAIGAPTPQMRRHYTLVVKGHIALAAIRFPAGTTGAELDVLARQHLWNAGLDYGHGTGHGVGCYLGVHEGPQNISRRSTVPLQPGMVLSNEPGYYLPGEYGIRFENLMLVTAPAVPAGGVRAMLGFEILTLSPLDRALLQHDLLTAPERDWINTYHARIRHELQARLDPVTAKWLHAMTEPL